LCCCNVLPCVCNHQLPQICITLKYMIYKTQVLIPLLGSTIRCEYNVEFYTRLNFHITLQSYSPREGTILS
jgi:hypothetical protein